MDMLGKIGGGKQAQGGQQEGGILGAVGKLVQSILGGVAGLIGGMKG